MRLKPVGIFVVVCTASFVWAGCGGAGTQTCALYDQGSAAYFVARGRDSSQAARTACMQISREVSKSLRSKWTTQKNPKVDYHRDVHVCRRRLTASGYYSAEIEVYDSRSGDIGRLLCAAFATVKP